MFDEMLTFITSVTVTKVSKVSKVIENKNNILKNYRYTLEPYKGKTSRFKCPHCKKHKSYSRYIDLKTGEHLPYKYGRCNRESKCCYHLNPYKDGYKKDEVIKFYSRTVNTPKSQKKITIPLKYFKESLQNYHNNSFVDFLNKSFGNQKTKQVIKQFYIGTSDLWKGSTVFWLIDEKMKIRGGQVILFSENGRTKTVKQSNGFVKRYNSWIHIAIRNSIKDKNLSCNKWLKEYYSAPKSPCLFGLPQLHKENKDRPIAIVESSKTAIIMSAVNSSYIWMATGGLSYLNEARLKPLISRKVILFPDKGCFNHWKSKTEKFRLNFDISVSDTLEQHIDIKEGEDLADLLFNSPKHQRQLPLHG